MRARRVAMTAAAALAGLALAAGAADDDADYLARMTQEHAGDTPVASGAAREPDAPTRSERVTYATVEGKPVQGFLARPAQGSGPYPGVIVIHEWWGLNDNVRDMTRQLAGEGYAALAVDLYEGESAADPARARELVRASMGRRAALESNLRQAHAYLEGELRAPKVGSIGWCFGGGWSLGTALLLPAELDAAVIYYGRLVTDREQLASLQTPILGLFGAEDRGIPVAQVIEFQAALEALGKRADIHIYEGADHAFANPSGTRYDAVATEDAWGLTVAFLAEHLR